MSRRDQGFSLLELLVALAVFATLSVMAYGGLRSVLGAEQELAQRGDRLRALQGALSMLERDLRQLIARPVRDEYGDEAPALRAGDFGSLTLELTRAGRANPLGQRRSSLQRVAYLLEGENLIRLSWAVLDRAQDSEPYRFVLLEGVRSLELRFLDWQLQWQESWPVDSLDEKPLPPLPKAVELLLEVNDFGTIRRLIRTADGPEQPS